MTDKAHVTLEEERAIQYVKDVKGCYTHLLVFVVVMTGLSILNFIVIPQYLWIMWVLMGWGLGVTIHAITVFEVFSLFGPGWEKRQIEKRLGRKL